MALLTDTGGHPRAHHMLTLGVTGGIGSGKSVVCGLLQERGARIFRADEVGKKILAADPDARTDIVREFGHESYHADGTLNRRYLAEIVFGDPERLAAINAIVHPRVFDAFRRVRQEAAEENVRLLVHEAALLFESGGDRYVDCTVYVDAPRWLRIRRVMERDNKTRREVVSRMEHQLPAYRGRQRSDFVLNNDDTLAKLEARVARLIRRLEDRYGLSLVET